jgi:uncharacterized protein YdhG (YjbR/CyaY superfamily)
MDKAKPNSVIEYIANIPVDQKPHFEKLRAAILNSIDKDFEECISYGMLGFVVPFSIYPEGYHCDPKLPLPFANLAAQKNSINLYHMGIYGSPELLSWFQTEYTKMCKYKLDMGKACIRFKKYEDIPYDLITELFSKITAKEYIAQVVYTLKK